ncbi:hypothetical protein D9M69_643510 [compost metagenome]
MAGDDHDRQRRAPFDQPILQFEAGHAGHADIDDQTGDFARVVSGEKGFGGLETADSVVLAFEQPLQ